MELAPQRPFQCASWARRAVSRRRAREGSGDHVWSVSPRLPRSFKGPRGGSCFQSVLVSRNTTIGLCTVLFFSSVSRKGGYRVVPSLFLFCSPSFVGGRGGRDNDVLEHDRGPARSPLRAGRPLTPARALPGTRAPAREWSQSPGPRRASRRRFEARRQGPGPSTARPT